MIILFQKIDQQADFLAGHALLNFMDVNDGYHQIPLAQDDYLHVLTSLGNTYFDVGLDLNTMFAFGMVRREFTNKKVLLRMSLRM